MTGQQGELIDQDLVTGWWATDISRIRPGEIAFHGYPIEQLIGRAGFAEMVWLMLTGELPDRARGRLLEAALVSAVDHGPQAPSIAAARMAATCGVGLNNAIATGVNLLGDVHGGAGQQCMQVLAAIRDRVADGASIAETVEQTLAEHKAARRHVPGFGHRFHPRDPRRDPLIGLLQQAVQDGLVSGDYLAIGLELEAQLAQGRAKPVPMNIDGATALIYAELGFEPELGRALFVLSRSVGIMAHAWEEKQSGARIKGPIPRPLLADYTGPELRDVPAADDARLPEDFD
ncbi:citryl-CoA lyase [Actinoalloteichus hymeniacidonis]|uniref:citrate synthase (unknown stereospecificity) n=1 Tax=Actinoalloteichus hymeniacidonis TaxID=340345 RepID=A0AAC9HWU9_9PSEU|nr:citryl-CoA lyase [Actinoalloteichus hymeniacidonis]AOS65930.1 Citrate synthase [Actinoalloteichus hymeniacidonis]MBB5905974.1 citrate synthase [Actinoalloteichus hymeniacidonis]